MTNSLTQISLGRLFPPCFLLVYKLQILGRERGKVTPLDPTCGKSASHSESQSYTCACTPTCTCTCTCICTINVYSVRIHVDGCVHMPTCMCPGRETEDRRERERERVHVHRSMITHKYFSVSCSTAIPNPVRMCIKCIVYIQVHIWVCARACMCPGGKQRMEEGGGRSEDWRAR